MACVSKTFKDDFVGMEEPFMPEGLVGRVAFSNDGPRTFTVYEVNP